MLFLNNAINHGVLTPLGIQQAVGGHVDPVPARGQPRPRSRPPDGLLLRARHRQGLGPGAAIIQFFGGIHEIYFPYVLMKPKMILATIGGGMTGIFLLVLFDRAPRSGGSGSIIAVYAQTPRGEFMGISVAVFGAALVSFPVGRRRSRWSAATTRATCTRPPGHGGDEGQEVAASSAARGDGDTHEGPIHDIVFACDAGMGSSAMGASILRRKVHEAGTPTSPSSTRRSPTSATTTTSSSPTRT